MNSERPYFITETKTALLEEAFFLGWKRMAAQRLLAVRIVEHSQYGRYWKDSLGFLESSSIGEFTLAFQYCPWYKLPVYTTERAPSCRLAFVLFLRLLGLAIRVRRVLLPARVPLVCPFRHSGAYNSKVVLLICNDSYDLRLM